MPGEVQYGYTNDIILIFGLISIVIYGIMAVCYWTLRKEINQGVKEVLDYLFKGQIGKRVRKNWWLLALLFITSAGIYLIKR